MNRILFSTIALLGLLGLGACGTDEETTPAGDVHGEMPMGDSAQEMTGSPGMPGMEGMMRRHAQEADSMTSALRAHIRQMRELPPEQWHDRMGEHVAQVSKMLTMTSRQMREMDMGMGMSDEEMGGMMGMSGEEHRKMMDEMQALRADLEQLQTASAAQVRERMPEHLDRLERMVEMMEQSAAHMAAM